ncbi:MAG: fibronectin type III domain-containing protein [Myxococcota bacterium]|nr:fibronectin type III domain-containing protein [Myxococcota bacterium]
MKNEERKKNRPAISSLISGLCYGIFSILSFLTISCEEFESDDNWRESDHSNNEVSSGLQYAAEQLFFDDFETDKGWIVDPNGTDSATTGIWERANPETTSYGGITYQLGTSPSGVYDLVTGALGGGVGTDDIDNGTTSIRSPEIQLPSSGDITLSFQYYMSHYNSANAGDFFRVLIEADGIPTSTVLNETGSSDYDGAAWESFTTSLNNFAGHSIHILFEAADGPAQGTLVEAAIDDVLISIEHTTGCEAPQGLNANAITESSADLSWNPVVGANSYTLRYREAPDGSWRMITPVLEVQYHLYDLMPSSQYEFQVSASCGQESSPYSTAFSFTTESTEPNTVVFFDDFESNKSWVVNPYGTDTATTGIWERANPVETNYYGTVYQLGVTPSGQNDLVTGASGASAGSNDVDNGTTSIHSPEIRLPSQGDITLSFQYYFSHYSTANTNDYLRISIESAGMSTVQLLEETGSSAVDGASWEEFSTGLNDYSGRDIRLLIEVADGTSSGTLIEAAIDDVLISVSNTGNCESPTGLVADNLTENGATLSWHSVIGADSYDLRYKEVADGTWTLITHMLDTQFELNDLVSQTQYEFQVSANCGSDASPFSPSHVFTTDSDGSRYHLDMIVFRDIRACAVGKPCGLFYDDFERGMGWTVNPDGDDSAQTGRWERAEPQCTDYQNCEPVSGDYTLVTGALAGSGIGSHDIDGGLTTVLSSPIQLPQALSIELSLSYYFAHMNNATVDDFLMIEVLNTGAPVTIFEKTGSASDVPPTWDTIEVSLAEFSGQSIQLRIRAADAGTPSLIEAGVDNVLITTSSDDCFEFEDDNEIPQVRFSYDDLQILEPSDPRVSDADHVHCFRSTLTESEVTHIHTEITEMRNKVFNWTNDPNTPDKLLELDIDFHDVTESVEMEMGVWGAGPYLYPWDASKYLVQYLSPQTDFVIVSHHILDRETGYHTGIGGCGGAYGAHEAELAGAGYSWVPFTGGSPIPINCAVNGVYTHEWMHQLYAAVHHISQFEDCYGNPSPSYPLCGDQSCDPKTWFPDVDTCHLDPDAPYCGASGDNCGEHDEVHSHILGEHWPLQCDSQLCTIYANHCKNGVEDFGEIGIDQGGPCL